MDLEHVKRITRGPMIPVITHYNADLSLDLPAIAENVRTLVQRGIATGQGMFLAGGAGGDFPMLSLDERKQVARVVVEAADGQAPVAVSIQDTNVSNSIELAQWADSIGAAMVQLSPTYYYQANAETTLRLFRTVHEATNDVVIMAYNAFWEGYDMPLEVVDCLSELPRCRAIKWATPDIARYMRGIARFAPRMAVIDNQMTYTTSHMLGGTAFISHLATVWPEHELAIWGLLEKQEYAAAQAKEIAGSWPFHDIYVRLQETSGAESPVVKAALDLCGRPGGPCRLPVRELNREERMALERVLRNIGVPELA